MEQYWYKLYAIADVAVYTDLATLIKATHQYLCIKQAAAIKQLTVITFSRQINQLDPSFSTHFPGWCELASF